MSFISSGVLLEVPDHQQLRVDQLLDVLTELLGQRTHDHRQPLLHPRVHGRLQRRRQVLPQPRVLPFHDPLDHAADLDARGRRHVVGDLVRLELAVEVADAADLQQRLVDRDRRHLRHP
jgi:hypothetical protein